MHYHEYDGSEIRSADMQGPLSGYERFNARPRDREEGLPKGRPFRNPAAEERRRMFEQGDEIRSNPGGYVKVDPLRYNDPQDYISALKEAMAGHDAPTPKRPEIARELDELSNQLVTSRLRRGADYAAVPGAGSAAP